MSLFDQINNINICNISKYDLYIHEIDNGIEYFYYSDNKKHKTKNIKVTKYYKCDIYIHEYDNFYSSFDKKNIAQKLYNKKKLEYLEIISNNIKKYYKCVFLDLIIVKITNECIVAISKSIFKNDQGKRLDIFNNLNVFIEWLYSSGYFSSDDGSSSGQANEEKINEYKKQFNIEITKTQITTQITNILSSYIKCN